MMVLWRISNYADLKGTGGLRAPGRWHFAGRPVVYLAEHPAGALLETLVHQEIRSTADLPDTYRLLRVAVGVEVGIAELGEAALPGNWREDAAYTQSAGSEWLESGSTALLKVPSAVMPYAYNYLLNPVHADVGEINVEAVIDVRHDPRILRLLARP
ncbi:RES family NAD+ phosphorylase [Caballeronia sp. LZ035]|uniref:RES family NAD+ phosphorylase n=1 Tax=Caballeronia sp. LZ035 TaxID=3038568 RepID=UPI0028558AF4|nr:RES family NAD+ phosphorylase [Caballeronia sp. LZ035]MDR5761481.1 RES family NAD+ phosphorylase [Caballeronia sp. LZ035]